MEFESRPTKGAIAWAAALGVASVVTPIGSSHAAPALEKETVPSKATAPLTSKQHRLDDRQLDEPATRSLEAQNASAEELQFLAPPEDEPDIDIDTAQIEPEPIFVTDEDELDDLEPGFAILDVTGGNSREKRWFAGLEMGIVSDDASAITLQIEGGERNLGYEIGYTRDAIAGPGGRDGFRVSFFDRRHPNRVFLSDAGDDLEEVFLPVGDEQVPWVHRMGGSFRYYIAPSETLTLIPGITYQRVSVRNRAVTDNVYPRDENGNRLVFGDDGKEDLLTVSFAAVQDAATLENDLWEVRGSRFQFRTEQAIPVGEENIAFHRLSGFYSQFIPFGLFGFDDGPRTLALNLQAGTFIGEAPPYEAFALGGSSSVRGYRTGDVGAGHRFVQATAEYRFPIITSGDGTDFFEQVRGVLFVDYASDLGSGDEVRGEPAEVRDKDGSGLGFGLGLRITAPFLEVVRLDFGITDEGNSRLTFGVGERF